MVAEAVDINFISMLHPESLDSLTEYARRCQGGIVEVGPYVGGSTLAIARGNLARRPHAVVEPGGSHVHPTHGSQDIIADWLAHTAHVRESHNILFCKGWSFDTTVTEAAARHAAPIGLVFIDTDGFLASPLRTFANYMRPDCLLALDDYWAPGAEEKANLVKPFIDQCVSEGHLIEDAVRQSTWYGKVSGQAALDYFKMLRPMRPDSGHTYWVAATPDGADSVEHPLQSKLRLFEDGVELGPAHSLHAEIQELGAGRFSHWGDGFMPVIWFSSSDNSDPRTNGRRYAYRVDEGPEIAI